MVRFLKTSELAEMTGMTARALEDDRATGQLGGIPFVRFGRSVRYRIDDVERWSESRRFIGGNECTAGAAGPGGAHDTARRGSTPRPATRLSTPAGVPQHPTSLLSSLPPAGVVSTNARKGIARS